MTKRILHIDDQVSLTEMCKELAPMVFGMGISYETSTKADELIPSLERAAKENRPYDGVILDNDTLSEMKGLEALAQARAAGYSTPVIVYCTIKNMEPRAAIAYIRELGAEYVEKPNTLGALRTLKNKLSQGSTSPGTHQTYPPAA